MGLKINTNIMKRLEQYIKKNGFLYKQIKREGNLYIYAQGYGSEKEFDPIAYEVFFAREQKEGDATIGGVDIHYENKELFPGDEDFGKMAWSFRKIEWAEKRFSALLTSDEFSSQ
jgi:hypothetical protein